MQSSGPGPQGPGPLASGGDGRPDVGPWPALGLVGRAVGGSRSEVWLGDLDDQRVAVRRSRRRGASLEWELDLLAALAEHGFLVPQVIPAADGSRHIDGLVVQQWIPGRRPEGDADWRAVAQELVRLHQATRDHLQRPGCCSLDELDAQRRSVDADLASLPTAVEAEIRSVLVLAEALERAVIRGDPGPDNVRLTAGGRVGFLDWDEARVDVTVLDLADLGVPVLPPDEHVRATLLADAWETVNAWTAEPAYARRRLASLRRRLRRGETAR